MTSVPGQKKISRPYYATSAIPRKRTHAGHRAMSEKRQGRKWLVWQKSPG
jgi:hypothetical protein